MIGSFLAILSAITFALNNIFLRRAVLNIFDASLGMFITVPLAVPLVLLILAFSGQMQSLLCFSFQGYGWLSLAGILFYVVGRSLFYHCIQLVGANITNILRRFSILVSVFIGITVLHEPLSWQLVTGVLLIIIGVTLVGLSPQMFYNTSGRFSKIPIKGFLLGIGCGGAVGTAHICAKLGLKGSGSPIAGVFISFLAATIVLSLSLVNRRRRALIAHITAKAAGLFFIAGLLSCIASLILYAALNLAPASVVVPLISISPVFLLTFSFFFNRKLEIFSIPVIMGTVTVVSGTILLV